MTLQIGEKLPAVDLMQKTGDGPVFVSLAERLKGRKVVLFGLPGAFTPTCDAAHLPSFIRTKDQFDEKGVDEIICVSVNDVHVMALWGDVSGATAAGITLLADPDARFTKAIGMNFTNAEKGMYDRSNRYALVAEDGVVTVLQIDDVPGTCVLSAGEAMLDALGDGS